LGNSVGFENEEAIKEKVTMALNRREALKLAIAASVGLVEYPTNTEAQEFPADLAQAIEEAQEFKYQVALFCDDVQQTEWQPFIWSWDGESYSNENIVEFRTLTRRLAIDSFKIRVENDVEYFLQQCLCCKITANEGDTFAFNKGELCTEII